MNSLLRRSGSMLRCLSTDARVGSILQLPRQFLRSSDSTNYDQITQQRIDVAFDNHSGKPIETSRGPIPEIKDCSVDGNVYRVAWKDGMVSEFSSEWVEKQLAEWNGRCSGRVLWQGMTEEDLRVSKSVQFKDLLTSEGQSRGLRHLFEHGILLVTSTPIDDNGAGIAAMASALGGGSVKSEPTILNHYVNGEREIHLPRGTDGPLRTLYGTVWSTTTSGQVEGASVADSAYGCDGLPLHTDMTYMRDPPGLQIFTMVQPATRGGESVFADGFAAAERLRQIDPHAFNILSTTARCYRSTDSDTGWHLEARGPVIGLRNEKITSIRHNDLDRLPDLPPPGVENTDGFYEQLERAHQSWDSILGLDEIRLVVKLRPGETVVVANQRCFHGRYSFEISSTSSRSVAGCYVSQDELDSRFRMEGFRP